REPASPRPVAGGFPHTPAGAATAATAWLQGAPDALTNGTWDATVSAFVTPTFQAVARRADPGAALMQSRLNAPHAPPYAVRIWPLGFAVSQYSPTSARVRVWQLGVLEIARPTDVIGYTTTTVSLQWLGGDWKIAGILHGPALTPPGSTSTATEVTAWIAAVKQLHSYSYAP
ncbi:MAG: hypothetical protein QOJ25_3113, partial [Solirubrobacteraceae bacterium]|nr:hypothetical protein [Solirubrobacteraceae bacterium]